MPAEPKSDFHREIAHVLFIDVVGYSKMLIDEQSEALQALNEIVRKTEPFRVSEKTGKLIRIPAGDGMALLFFNSPEAPVDCALETSKAIRFDRALDILPNDPDMMAFKATIYQGEGNLEEAAKLLGEVNVETPSVNTFGIKITQLTLERNLSEAVRLLQARVAQYHFGSELEKGVFTGILAFTQRLAGDAAGAKITAERARNTLEPICKNQPENDFAAITLSRAYAVLGDKNSALKEAGRAIALTPSARDAARGPGFEENLALIRTIIGENSGAISTLTRLLEMPYQTTIYGTPITPALLRLDPTWDPLRADPAFRKLCEEKKE